MDIVHTERMEMYKIQLAQVTANNQGKGSMHRTGFALDTPQGIGMADMSTSQML